MSAAVPHNVVQSFANDGISLILDDKGIIRCQITPHTMRCVIGTSFVPSVSDGALDQPGKEEDLNIGDFLGPSRNCSSLLNERWRRNQ
jgi:hypothetical protein